MSSRLAHKRLFVADLLRRVADLEHGTNGMNALLYRVLAKQLQGACGGLADWRLATHFGAFNAQIEELLQDRHFNDHGLFVGAGALQCQQRASQLLARLGVRPGSLG